MREAGTTARAGPARFALRSRLGLGSDLVQQLTVGCGAELQVTEFKSLQFVVASGPPEWPWRVTANYELQN